MSRRYASPLVLAAIVVSVALGAFGCGRVQALVDKAREAKDKPGAGGSGEVVPIVSGSANTAAAPRGPVKEATGHPRLFIRESDVSRLRSWANERNPLWVNGLKALIDQAVANEAKGELKEDPGSPNGYTQHPTEDYAMLFAFYSLVAPTESERTQFAKKARTLLMSTIDKAAKGPASEQPFRDPGFAIKDRARWSGYAFAVTTDWIYGTLTADDKKKIRTVFLRWAADIEKSETTTYNHPEPVGVVNDPKLLADIYRVRWAGNNHYLGHMRNLGLMSMALDAADDPGEKLRGRFATATGAFLYMTDALMRGDMRGGMGAEGFEYSPLAMGYTAELLLAIYTAGRDDPAKYGRQVTFEDNPFWKDVLSGYFHSLSPIPKVPNNEDLAYMGDVYQVAWYGDGEKYWAIDFIDLLGAMGIYDSYTGNNARLQQIRWAETNLPPGGAAKRDARVNDFNGFLGPIFYFLLFDPNAPPAPDPRPTYPLTHFAEGIGRFLQRTSWRPDATWFTYKLGWISLDHQFGDGNMFELWRKGEWLTKERTGYGDDVACSDYKNTIALENDRPFHHKETGYRKSAWQRGSQWPYVASGDPKILARRSGPDFTYFLGDATPLYNSKEENSLDIVHASRSLVYIVPDRIVTYDRAESKKEKRFKRFWMQLPNQGTVSGPLMTMRSDGGQNLYVRTLLPEKPAIHVEKVEPLDDDNGHQPALLDPIKFRMKVEAPGNPKKVRWLHVIQGADGNVKPDDASLVIGSTGGSAYEGAAFHDTVVMFPVDIGPVTAVKYTAPIATKAHLVTGLTPNAGYTVTTQRSGREVNISVTAGGSEKADSGGVLLIGKLPP